MTANRSNGGALALAAAEKWNGHPYVWGGTLPESNGTDCSGLVQWAYEQVGVVLARTTYGQYKQFAIPNSLPSEPGDLLFVAGSDGIGTMPGHVMMFVSKGEVFQAPETGELIGRYPYDTSQFEYRTRPALALAPPKLPPTKNPSALQLANAGLVLLTNPNQAHVAIENGWTVYVWGGYGFVPTPKAVAKGTPQYANKGYTKIKA